MQGEQLTEAQRFLLAMEEYGLHEALERHLPAEFALVYEIARVLEDPDHPLTQRLAPLLHRSIRQQQPPDASPPPSTVQRHFVAEEYDAELIRHLRDVVHIYPHQFLLPDEVFYHRLAERSLWMPAPRPPQVYGYKSQADQYAPDIRKQKLYVLFDTSASMQSHHRIHLAKAIVYVFLRRNQAELGEIFFRTFDLQLGERWHAHDVPSFERLLQHVLRLQAVGQGTALEHAICVAAEEIRQTPSLLQSEILLITDGIAYLHVEKLRALLGDQIRLNAIRLGSGHMEFSARTLEDFAQRDDSTPARYFRQLQAEKRHLEHQLAHTRREYQRRLLQNQLRRAGAAARRCGAPAPSACLRTLQHGTAAALHRLYPHRRPAHRAATAPHRGTAAGMGGIRRPASGALAAATDPAGAPSSCASGAAFGASVQPYTQWRTPPGGLRSSLRQHIQQVLRTGMYGAPQQPPVRLSRAERRWLATYVPVRTAPLGVLLPSVRRWLRWFRLWIRRLLWRYRWRWQ
jgi:hypothetical protein